MLALGWCSNNSRRKKNEKHFQSLGKYIFNNLNPVVLQEYCNTKWQASLFVVQAVVLSQYWNFCAQFEYERNKKVWRYEGLQFSWKTFYPQVNLPAKTYIFTSDEARTLFIHSNTFENTKTYEPMNTIRTHTPKVAPKEQSKLAAVRLLCVISSTALVKQVKEIHYIDIWSN